MTRSVTRFARWKIHREKLAAVPEITYEMECAACSQRSPVAPDFETASNWAFQHSGRNITHTGYREIIHRYWKTELIE